MTAVRLSKMVDEEGKEQHTLKVEGDLKNAEEQVPLNPEAEPKKKGIDWGRFLSCFRLETFAGVSSFKVLPAQKPFQICVGAKKPLSGCTSVRD